MVACGVQFLLLFPTIFLIIGAAKKIRCLMLPYLVLFGLGQIGLFLAIIACVLYLPIVSGQIAFSCAVAVTATEALIIFPWWYGVIHLFAVYDKAHVHKSYLMYSGAPPPPPRTNSEIISSYQHTVG